LRSRESTLLLQALDTLVSRRRDTRPSRLIPLVVTVCTRILLLAFRRSVMSITTLTEIATEPMSVLLKWDMGAAVMN
jgi:hypothetical protein